MASGKRGHNELETSNEEQNGDADVWVPYKQRRLMEHKNREAKLKTIKKLKEGSDEDEDEVNIKKESTEAEVVRPVKSLFDQKVEMLKNPALALKLLAPNDGEAEEEEKYLENLSDTRKPLISVAEIANDIKYERPMPSNWRPPRFIENATEEEVNKIREEHHILVEGEEVPKPIERFKDLKIPRSIVHLLASKGIKTPTPIQIQGLPVILSGRDMIGIAFTGSGKTLVFTLPMVLIALQQELRHPLINGEGPFAMVICPSRELARQTYDLICEMTEVLHSKDRFPRLKTLLCIGGIPLRDQFADVRSGAQMIVATPGRLVDMLNKGKFHLLNCKYLVMDEADRLVDAGFEEEVRSIMDHFKYQRQTVLFSATMPKKIQNFAKSALVQPVVVNVGRAGAANLDVVQEVEYVKPEAKIVYLLDCLQKTPPPVLIFCESKYDVDDIHEYLLVKGVETVGIHGDKDQQEREEAIALFKSGRKDVLVATDVASKGLDFPDVKHVINFDMPKEIENYVHRIGRTGRRGRTGLATTFINRNQSDAILLDLKQLLKEAKQRIPPALEYMDFGLADEKNECQFCGGLGHRLSNCPKFQKQQKQQIMPRGSDQMRD